MKVINTYIVRYKDDTVPLYECENGDWFIGRYDNFVNTSYYVITDIDKQQAQILIEQANANN